jgi:ribose transport system ATP-binding protein
LNEVVIEGKGICRDFSGVRVLFDVDIAGRRGEIHGIVGENGAGKSTLMNILGGVLPPTEGKIFFQGREVSLNPKVAKELGIALIPQELNLVESLTVYENIFLGRETCKGLFLHRKAMVEHTKEALRLLGLESLDPATLVEHLSTAQKQLVEIARVVLGDIAVLIMDEPTATLTEHEVQTLFGIMRSLKERGVCIFYVSHRLKEVREICDRVTVLRDGRVVASYPTQCVTEEDIARFMVGRSLDTVFPPRDTRKDEVVLEVRHLTVENAVHDVSFTLYRGEVLGFAGLVGSGRSEMAEGIIGLRKKKNGEILLEGKRLDIRSPQDAKYHGIVYLPEERKSSGIIASMPVRENITLMVLERFARPFLDRKQEVDIAAHRVQELHIRCKNLDEPVEFLSGGNQQKVVFARLMEVQPKVYILDEPTRGIDVGTKHYIYHLIRDLARAGLSFIVISSDLPEVIGLCDRIAVMREGRIVAFLEGGSTSEEEVILYITGLRKGAVYA